MKIAMISLGCWKNRVDSEIIMGKLATSGYKLTGVVEDADIVVLNTCAFLKQAVKEAENYIEKLALLKSNGLKKLVIVGCLVERFREKIKAVYPEVDELIVPSGYRKIDSLIKEDKSYLGNKEKDWIADASMPRLISTPPHYAYLKVAEGCSNNCSYCLVPVLRGKQRSRSIEDVVEEAKMLEKIGVKELLLLAQDLSSYGMDNYGRPMLLSLLAKLDSIKNIKWIRLLYLHPSRVNEELINFVAASKKILKYIEFPIQHASDNLLSKMKRGYTQQELKKKIKLLKDKGFVLRSSVMVGFPGETEQDFQELIEFVKWAKFNHLITFRYSDEKEAPSYKMKEKVDEEVKIRREEKILKEQKKIASQHNSQLVGKLISSVVDFKGGIGRTWQDAPEIDRKLKIEGPVKEGKFYKVKITKVKGHWLYGSVVNEETEDNL